MRFRSQEESRNYGGLNLNAESIKNKTNKQVNNNKKKTYKTQIELEPNIYH